MIDPQPEVDGQDLSNASQALLARLCDIATEPGRRLFAVLDGARFDNLPSMLREADVLHRPLYRHAGGDYAIVVGGPWLVDPSRPALFKLSEDAVPPDDRDNDLSDEALQARAARLSDRMMTNLKAGDPSGGGMLTVSGAPPTPDQASRIEALLRIADRRSAIVFWVGDETMTAEALFRHLRSINRVVIPRGPASDVFDGGRAEIEAAAEENTAETANQRADAGEMVIFRHADPNVMMQVFPVLDEERALRLFGPADQIFFAPAPIWGGGVKRARRPAGRAFEGRGQLRLDRDMIAMIEDARMQASRRKVTAYLRDVDPATAELTDAELMDRVLSYEASGTRLGLASERAHMKWAYLMSITNGGIQDSVEARDYFRLPSKHPDDAIDDLLLDLERAAGDDWENIWSRIG
ncbi:hypothetical protein CO655_06620 [Rhizobium sp. M1]|nr:hypothetical protein CO655_06620 [Rhizobium sp. M1]